METSKELDYLRDRVLLILDFIISRTPAATEMLQGFKAVYIEGHKRNDLRGLRTASRDMNAWAKGMTKNDMNELEKLLFTHFGENLSGDKLTHVVLKRTLKNGKIGSDADYRVVFEYLQDINSGDPFFENAAELGDMINAYLIIGESEK